MSEQKFLVELSSCGNPDLGQNPDRPISEPGTAEAETLAEAALACRRYITAWNLGAGNWSGGRVTDASGQPVAIVSYNGLLWKWDPDPLACDLEAISDADPD